MAPDEIFISCCDSEVMQEISMLDAHLLITASDNIFCCSDKNVTRTLSMADIRVSQPGFLFRLALVIRSDKVYMCRRASLLICCLCTA